MVYFKSNNGNNQLVPFKEKKEVTIVYLHGFMGDEKTFHDFPTLIEGAMILYNVIVKSLIKTFDTKGVFEDNVNDIIDWLYKNTNDNPIILMGHSMGGIIIADVYRKIMNNDVPFLYKLEKKPKIFGVIGFDSPYFGLSSYVADAGVRRVKETFTAASNFISSLLSSNNNNNNNNLENSGDSEEKANINQKTPTNNRGNSDNSNNSNNSGGSRWNFFSNVVLGTAAVAAIGTQLFNNQETREAVVQSGQQIISESKQYIMDYSKFLQPLITFGKQDERINDLIKYMENPDTHLLFKDYYPITPVENENGLSEKTTFISLPSKKEYFELFDFVPAYKKSSDPIDSHTKMFNSMINQENAHLLANKCVNDIYNIVKSIKLA